MKLVLLSPLVLLVVQTISAQSVWSNDPAVNTIVCDAENTQSNAQTISDGAGGATIVWQDFRTTGLVAIYAQRFDASGEPKWTQNGVLVFQADTAQPFFFKHAITDGARGVIVCWSAKPMGNLTGVDIFVQKIDSSGSPRWTTNGYPICFALGNQFQPSMCSNGAGGAVVAWVDGRSGSLFNFDIYAQHINAAGMPLWQPTNGAPVCTGINGGKGLPMLIPDTSGGAIVAWTDTRRSFWSEPYLQKLNPTGQRMWDTSGVSASTLGEDKQLTGITTDGAGGAIVGWQQNYSLSGYRLVVAQRVSASGTLLWGDEGTWILDSQPRSYVPRFISDRAGGAIFVWRDVRDSMNTGEDLFAQRLNGQGMKVWNVNGVPICRAPGLQGQVSMAHSEDGGVFIAWIDGRNGDSNYDIYAQRISLGGVTGSPANGLAVSTAPNNQLRPSMVSDGRGSAIVAWDDGRTPGNLDIYCQRLANLGMSSPLGLPITQGQNMQFSIGTTALLTSNFASAGSADSMTVVPFLNVSVPNLIKSLPRYLELSANGTGYTATLTFNYTDLEVLAAGLINGDANLKLYRDGGSGWELMGGTVDTAANTVTITGVTAFSRWAMRDPTDTIAVGVGEETGLPGAFVLHQNYPNPFNPSTTIKFSLPSRSFSQAEGRGGEGSMTTLRVYDLLGREVATLVNEVKQPGNYEVAWDARGMATGVYFYKLQAGNFAQTKKLLLLR
jgi:hypothetical protein